MKRGEFIDVPLPGGRWYHGFNPSEEWIAMRNSMIRNGTIQSAIFQAGTQIDINSIKNKIKGLK